MASINNSQNTSLIKKTIAIFIGLLSFTAIAFFSKIVPVFKDFTEKNVRTYDGIIDDSQIYIIKLALVFFIAVGLIISITLFLNLHKIFLDFIKRNFKLKTLKKLLIKDKLTSKTWHTKLIFYVATFWGITFHLWYLIFGEILEEGFLENLSAFMFLIGALILITTLFYLPKFQFNKKGIIVGWILLCALALILIFGEELSWGQHYFGWEASGAFQENNFQSETNFHNFLNPLFRFIYPFAGMGLFLSLTFIWLYSKKGMPYWFKLMLPHPSLVLLTFFIASASFIGESEIFEMMFSMFVLLYCLRFFMCLKYPKKSLIKQTTSSQGH